MSATGTLTYEVEPPEGPPAQIPWLSSDHVGNNIRAVPAASLGTRSDGTSARDPNIQPTPTGTGRFPWRDCAVDPDEDLVREMFLDRKMEITTVRTIAEHMEGVTELDIILA